MDPLVQRPASQKLNLLANEFLCGLREFCWVFLASLTPGPGDSQAPTREDWPEAAWDCCVGQDVKGPHALSLKSPLASRTDRRKADAWVGQARSLAAPAWLAERARVPPSGTATLTPFRATPPAAAPGRPAHFPSGSVGAGGGAGFPATNSTGITGCSSWAGLDPLPTSCMSPLPRVPQLSEEEGADRERETWG